MWSMPLTSPFAIDGDAPSTTTNRIADSESLNTRIAKGNHAIEGMLWSTVMKEPNARRRVAARRRHRAGADQDRQPESRRRALHGGGDGGPELRGPHQLADLGEDARGPGQHVAGTPADPHDRLPDGQHENHRCELRPGAAPNDLQLSFGLDHRDVERVEALDLPLERFAFHDGRAINAHVGAPPRAAGS
jgi:hypothetical protein